METSDDEVICLTDIKPKLPFIKPDPSPILVEDSDSVCSTPRAKNLSYEDSPMALVMDVDEVEDDQSDSQDESECTDDGDDSTSTKTTGSRSNLGKESFGDLIDKTSVAKSGFRPIIVNVQGNCGDIHTVQPKSSVKQTLPCNPGITREQAQVIQSNSMSSTVNTGNEKEPPLFKTSTNHSTTAFRAIPAEITTSLTNVNPQTNTRINQNSVSAKSMAPQITHLQTIRPVQQKLNTKTCFSTPVSTAPLPTLPVSNIQYVVLPNKSVALILPANTVNINTTNSQIQNKVGSVGVNKSKPPVNVSNQRTLDNETNTIRGLVAESIPKGQGCNHSQNPNSLKSSSIQADEELDKTVESILKNASENLILHTNDIMKSGLLHVDQMEKEACKEQFTCGICHEQFGTQEGELYHLKRNVFQLCYDCPICKTELTFYNKCEFWNHVLKDTSTAKLEISPSMSLRLKSRCPDSELCFMSLSEILKENNCEICRQHFLTEKDLHNHLKMASDRGSDLLFNTCSLCFMDLPNACAKAFHESLHEDTAIGNTICPECGDALPEGVQNRVKKFEHLDKCCHFNRRLAHVCPCNMMYKSLQDAQQHFLKKHLKTLYLCSFCSIGYIQPLQCMYHMQNIHGRICHEISSQVMCEYCKTICKDGQVLKNHMSGHFSTVQRVYGWKCFICPGIFTNISDLQEHAEKDHVHKAKRCTLCFGLFSSRQLLVKHILSKSCQAKLSKNLSTCLDISAPKSQSAVDYASSFKKVRVQQTPPPNASQTPGSIRETVSVQSGINPRGLGLSAQVPGSSKPGLFQKTPNSCSVRLMPKPFQSNQIRLQSDSNHGMHQNQAFSSSKTHQKETGSISSNTATKTLADKHQCHLCKIILQGKENYVEHLKKHAGKGKYISQDITRCVVCKTLVQNKNLCFHLQKHQTLGVNICIRCQRKDFQSVQQAKEHADNYCGYRLVEGSGEVVDNPPTQVELDKSAPTQNDDDSVQSDESSGDENLSPSDFNLDNHDVTGEENVIFPCLLCGLTFHEKQSLDDHVSRSHDGIKTVYCCLVCKKRGKDKTFKKKELASKHISVKHRICDPSEIDKLIKVEEHNVSSGKELITPQPSSIATVGDDSPAPKRLRLEETGSFLCGKCTFSCKDSSEFSKHILNHNMKKDPQCPECGLCFMVIPALKKHLFAVHKIKQVDDYIKAKDIVAPEEDEEDEDDILRQMLPKGVYYRSLSPVLSVEDEDDDENPVNTQSHKATSPLECTVCYRMFNTEVSLKKHMRNHGMAFIKSKRSRV